MPISAGLREDIAVYRGFIGQQYNLLSPQTLKLSKIIFAVISVMRLRLVIHYNLDYYEKC